MDTEKLEKVIGAEFALAVRFVTLIHSMRLPVEVIQAAKDQRDHPLWAAVKGALLPEEMPMSSGLELGVRSEDKAKIVQAPEIFIPRIQILRERPKPCAKRTVDDQVADLKRMYAELRWTWTGSGLIVPQRRKGIDRLLAFADTSFTNNRLYDVCEASFSSWRYAGDLDLAIPVATDERHPSRGRYFIWVQDEVGPDRDLMGLPANTIAKRRLKTETILEYMFHHLIHLRETGEHLDPRTLTQCCGSRNSDGDVPYAYWCGGRFRVNWCNPDDRNPNIGARQAVSL